MRTNAHVAVFLIAGLGCGAAPPVVDLSVELEGTLVYANAKGEVHLYDLAERTDRVIYKGRRGDPRLYPQWIKDRPSEIRLAGPEPLVLDEQGHVLGRKEERASAEWRFGSPSGEWVLVIDKPRLKDVISVGELLLASADGSEQRSVGSEVEFLVTPPLWLDTERFLFRRSGKNYVADVDESRGVRDIGYADFYFSDMDDRGELIGSDAYNIISMDGESFEARAIVSRDRRISRGLTWSPDGRYIVFSEQRHTTRDIFDLYVFDVEALERHALRVNEVYWSGDWRVP